MRPIPDEKNRRGVGVDAFDGRAVEISRIAQEIDDCLLRVVRRHRSAFDCGAGMRGIAGQIQGTLILVERGVTGGIIGIKETRP